MVRPSLTLLVNTFVIVILINMCYGYNKMENFKPDMCYHGSSDVIKRPMSYLNCTNECRSRSTCVAISVYTRMSLCRLHFDRSYTPLTCPMYMFSEKKDWLEKTTEGCESTVCSENNQKCEVENNQPSCKNSECSQIHFIGQGNVNGNDVRIGKKVSFSCNPGHSIFGSSTLVCEETGEWNDTVPVCAATTTPSASTTTTTRIPLTTTTSTPATTILTTTSTTHTTTTSTATTTPTTTTPTTTPTTTTPTTTTTTTTATTTTTTPTTTTPTTTTPTTTLLNTTISTTPTPTTTPTTSTSTTTTTTPSTTTTLTTTTAPTTTTTSTTTTTLTTSTLTTTTTTTPTTTIRTNKQYGDDCGPLNLCSLTLNLACRLDICRCMIGYVYNPQSKSCVKECPETGYGTTFQTYVNRWIPSLTGQIGSTRFSAYSECLHFCIDKECKIVLSKDSDGKILCSVYNGTISIFNANFEESEGKNTSLRDCASDDDDFDYS